MNTFEHFARFVRFVLLVVAATLLPQSLRAQSVLSVSPTAVSVQVNAGANAPAQTVRISNAGNRSLKWSVVQTSSGWLSVSPTTGVNNGTLTLTFRTSGLPAGQHQTSFRVESTTGSSIGVSVQATIVASALPPPPSQLTVICPANMSAVSSSGSPVAVTYAANTSGGLAPVTVTGSPASGSGFAVGTTPVVVSARSADGQTASCGFSVTVTYTAPPPPPTGDWTFCAPEGGFCSFAGTQQVRYGANGAYSYRTLSNGTSCTNGVFGDPIFGTAKECHFGAASTEPPPPPPPSPTGVGPQSTITCPAGAVDIWPGASIQNVVNSYAGNTTFCLRAGTHSLSSAIRPKTGNTFVGEYGAVLDGTGWSTTDATQAAFRAHNEDIDYVTIRNLVIRDMPQRGIHTFYWMSDHWTIENNEVTGNKWGVVFSPDFIVRNNYIHHNVGNASSSNPGERGGGYMGARAQNTILENNEIAYNGPEQKIGESANVTFRNNFVHHNMGDGIWYDGNCTDALVEGNRVEDNGRNGIFYEIGRGAIIRNNTVRRSGGGAVFISTSQGAQISNNTLENNFGSILYFLNCTAASQGYDLANNSSSNNTITVGTQSGAWGNGLSYTTDCTSTKLAAYLNGSKNLTFSNNAYDVPSTTSRYWLWNGLKSWSEWQGLGQDTTGTSR